MASAAAYHFFFFNDTATTEIYTLSLHDALPICTVAAISCRTMTAAAALILRTTAGGVPAGAMRRSEEHTSELQSQSNVVCRLLLEKKKHLRPTPRASCASHPR